MTLSTILNSIIARVCGVQTIEGQLLNNVRIVAAYRLIAIYIALV